MAPFGSGAISGTNLLADVREVDEGLDVDLVERQPVAALMHEIVEQQDRGVVGVGGPAGARVVGGRAGHEQAHVRGALGEDLRALLERSRHHHRVAEPLQLHAGVPVRQLQQRRRGRLILGPDMPLDDDLALIDGIRDGAARPHRARF